MTRYLACLALFVALFVALFAPAAAFAQAATAATAASAKPPVKFGIDVLRDDNFKTLAGKRVGLIANPASVDEHLAPTSHLLRDSEGVKLVALFGPEHGIYGDEYAGDKIADRKDPRTGIPIYSLYGKTRKPTPQMLEGLDTLVFDLQDIGSRSYTYISTLKVAMEACAELGKELVVLDRANPLGGQRVEGPGLDEKNFSSFVGILDVPYLHGMTTGEIAQLMRERFYPSYDKLRVVKMTGWTRDMVWQDTGRDWVPTSPHIPHARTCAAYAATGIVGELYVVSNGVGYTQPFELVGAPYIDGEILADALNEHWGDPRDYYEQAKSGKKVIAIGSDKPQGVYFRSVRFKPFYATFAKEPCQGVQVHVDAKSADTIVEINYRLMQALGAKQILEKAPARHEMFDKVNGSDEPRTYLMEGKDLGELFAKWRKGCESFKEARKKYLLY